VDEGLGIHQLVAMSGRHFDKIAEHIVEFQLERIDACLAPQRPLHIADDPAAVIAQAAMLIERGIDASGHKPALTRQQWRLIDQQRAQPVC